MAMRIDIFGSYDRELTEAEADAFQNHLRTYYCYSSPTDEVTERSFSLLYCSNDDLLALQIGINDWLPPDVTATLEIHYTECEEPGIEFEFHGPKDLILEYDFLQEKIADLEEQKMRVLRLIAERTIPIG
jgi:hypothetical protein